MMVMMVVPSNNEDEYEDVVDNNCDDDDDQEGNHCAHQNGHHTMPGGEKGRIDSLKGHLEFGTVAHIYLNLVPRYS